MNNRTQLTEREFELINVLASRNGSNQRELSDRTGMSLGMTNLVIRRLVKKGVLKIQQLNKKKVEYLLTPKGFSEKAKKSYRYVLKTVNNLNFLKSNIRDILKRELDTGQQELYLSGRGDIHDLIELAANSHTPIPIRINRIGQPNQVKKNAKVTLFVVDTSNQSIPSSVRTINILKELSEKS